MIRQMALMGFRRRPAGRSGLAAVAAGLLACGGEGGAATRSGDAGLSSGAGCEGDRGPCVTRAEGRFLDENGSPPEGVELVSVCGPVCFAGDLAPDGTFAVSIDFRLTLPDYSALLHGRPAYAGFYFPVPEPVDGVLRFGTLTAFALAPSGQPLPSETAAEQVVERDGIALHVPAGAELQLDFEARSAGKEGAEFRVRELRPSEFARLGAVPSEAVLVLAFAPFESHYLDGVTGERVPLGLSMPNGAGLAPNTRLEVHALGSYLYPDYVAPARFERVAMATVNADGTRIATRAGEGVELLTWIALVPATD